MQLRALTEAGVPAELVFTDKISGTQADRPGLAALMAQAREGDTLVLYSLDRLGRSLVHMVTTIDELIRRGVALRSLTDTINTTTGGRALPAQRVRGDGRVPTGADRGAGPGRPGGRPGPRGAAGVQIPDHPRAGPRDPPATPGRAGPLQDSPPGGSVQGGRWASVLRGEIKSLAHVSIELPEDEIDVWDAEALAATHTAPTPRGDR